MSITDRDLLKIDGAGRGDQLFIHELGQMLKAHVGRFGPKITTGESWPPK